MVSCCISFDSYTKPQLLHFITIRFPVVYLLIPTPNHNFRCLVYALFSLYIFWFLHQTTTWFFFPCHHWCCISFDSYTKPQPIVSTIIWSTCCISFDSYTKPQPLGRLSRPRYVVYLLIPTPNHNFADLEKYTIVLYIFWFLHQTTTCQHLLVSS